jgi:hypothetical protein
MVKVSGRVRNEMMQMTSFLRDFFWSDTQSFLPDWAPQCFAEAHLRVSLNSHFFRLRHVSFYQPTLSFNDQLLTPSSLVSHISIPYPPCLRESRFIHLTL